MASRPLAYVAGPYTHPDPVLNVERAVEVADALWDMGLVALIPHLTLLHHLISPKPVGDWYEIDLAQLEHCDLLVRFPGESVGADNEVRHAVERGIPCYAWEVFSQAPGLCESCEDGFQSPWPRPEWAEGEMPLCLECDGRIFE